MKTKIIVFADIDGTILDEKYNYGKTKPTIDKLLALDASIVLASSKTRAEVEFYRKHLGINDPFIVEDGSAIFIPRSYFRTAIEYTKQSDQYYVIELGMRYLKIREKLAKIRREIGANIIGFGDMTTQELAQDAGLPFELARLAKAREYDEPFRIIEGSEEVVTAAIENEGLCYTKGGRYFHLLGKTDKGKATKILKQLYQREFEKILTLGIGDSPNDLPMFVSVDKPYIITDEESASSCWQEILEVAEIAKFPRSNRGVNPKTQLEA